MIPMIGCRVRLLSGSHAGKEGTVVEVIDGRAAMHGMSEHEAKLFVKGKRATHGEDWVSEWYQAKVEIDGGGPPVPVAGRAEVQILTPDLLRPKRYRSV